MKTIIGIDPGSRCGIAIMKRKDREWTLSGCHTCDIDEIDLALSMVGLGSDKSEMEEILVVIENPPQGIFLRPGQNARAMMRIARNVGQCQARADEIRRMCESYGCTVKMVPPICGGTKRKIPGEVWRAMFGWKGRLPSNHARDAAYLARVYAQIDGFAPTGRSARKGRNENCRT